MGMRENHEQNSQLLIQLAPIGGIRVLPEGESDSSEGTDMYINDYCVDDDADKEEL